MADLDLLIQESDDLRERIINKFLDRVPDYEQKILKKIFELLDEYDTAGGKFVIEKANKRQLLKIQAEIEEIMKVAGYFKAANEYLRGLSHITENTIDLHKGINKLDIIKSSMTGIQKVYAENAVKIMSEGGLNVNFVQPVTNVVNEAISFGYSQQSVRDSLEEYVVGNKEKSGRLKSYLTVTARDTVSQLQGAQHQAIRNEYKMPYVRYVGGLLRDSRGQCVRWKGMQYIEYKDLQEEIDLAFKNQRAKLEMPDGHKWSGLIPDTTVENFLIRRGGYGCLHNAIPTRVKRRG